MIGLLGLAYTVLRYPPIFHDSWHSGPRASAVTSVTLRSLDPPAELLKGFKCKVSGFRFGGTTLLQGAQYAGLMYGLSVRSAPEFRQVRPVGQQLDRVLNIRHSARPYALSLRHDGEGGLRAGGVLPSTPRLRARTTSPTERNP